MQTVIPDRRHAVIDTRLGALTVVAEGDAIAGIYFPHHWHLPNPSTFGPLCDAMSDPAVSALGEQLAQYLAGDRHRFDVPVVLHGNAPQRRVWDLIAQVPYGETATYGDLARELGDGTIPRTVGSAVGRNPVSILVPCHRIVGAGGKLTGYAGGLERKQALLDLETAGVGSRLF